MTDSTPSDPSTDAASSRSPHGLTTMELFKEAMKFSAGHFTIFSATKRENLHGHNFTVYVALTGALDDNGMLADYGEYKRMLTDTCTRWNETFLLPSQSPHLRIERADAVEVVARFGDEVLRFLPRDVTLLPIRNVTLEELARLICETLTAGGARLLRDGIRRVVVKCASGPGQSCSWTWDAP